LAVGELQRPRRIGIRIERRSGRLWLTPLLLGLLLLRTSLLLLLLLLRHKGCQRVDLVLLIHRHARTRVGHFALLQQCDD
jgi:hypothetical protein